MTVAIKIKTLLVMSVCLLALDAEADRPNILFCISDDQSYAHAGANGDPVVQTPAFDRVAREGLRYVHAFCNAPTCGPSRSAILTGQPVAADFHTSAPGTASANWLIVTNSQTRSAAQDDMGLQERGD